MKLRPLKEGSRTKIKLGACCSSPATYSLWALGEETAFLRRRTQEHRPGESAEQGSTKRPDPDKS
jgi:hypothetical protein